MVFIRVSTRKIIGISAVIFLTLVISVILKTILPSDSNTINSSSTSIATIHNTASKVEITEIAEKVSTVSENTTNLDIEKQDLIIQHYTEQDAIDIAKVLYHECRGIPSQTEKACVAWTILNRVDSYNSTVYSVVRSPNQFAFYEDAPIWDELLDLSYDVLDRWNREQNGESNIGRVLPKEYIYFEGRDGHNHFRDNYSGLYNIWDYSLESPYES